LGAIIANPDAGQKTAERLAIARVEKLSDKERACAPGEAPLTAGFAPIGNVRSLTPLGALSAPGEPPPAPHLRIFAKEGRLPALAPGRVDIVAIERRAGSAGPVWTVRMKPCDGVALVYDGLETIDEVILRRAGGEAALVEIEKGRAALAVRIRLREGDVIGAAKAFNIGLIDLGAPAMIHASLTQGRAIAGIPEDPIGDISKPLERALALDETQARCPLDYLPADVNRGWREKLGDASGFRIKKGESDCAAAPPSPAGARGVWNTDSSHNARAAKVSAVILGADHIEEDRLVFSLHGRLTSLAPDLLGSIDLDEAARRQALKGALTAPVRDGRINPRFESVRANETYCYEDLRLGFEGPAIAGVFLLRIEQAAGAQPLMRIEAMGRAKDCISLQEPWTFGGNDTSFYR
jgi:hypothetical protein